VSDARLAGATGCTLIGVGHTLSQYATTGRVLETIPSLTFGDQMAGRVAL
jgi:hypothetical protein